MPVLHLRQPVFTHCACEPLTKHHERIHKFRETGSAIQTLFIRTN